MRKLETKALMLTLAAALLSGTAMAPAPAAAQGRQTDERSRFVTTPDGRTYYRLDEDERLSRPWAAPGRDPMSGNETRTDWRWQENERANRAAQSRRDPYDYGYQAGRDDERTRSGQSSSMAASRDQRAAMEFLDHARMQINRGNLREAWVALGQAETRLLSRSLPEVSSGEAAAGAAVGAIRDARQALRARETDRARALTSRATDLASSGAIVGRNVPGRWIDGAGEPGRSQPMRSNDWNTGSN